jgi:hypothetical protein
VNELLTYAVMLDSLIAAYILHEIMLIELQKVLSQELKCLCRKTTTVLSDWTVLKCLCSETTTVLSDWTVLKCLCSKTTTVLSDWTVLKCLCSKTTIVLSDWTVLKTADVSLLHFYCIRNKYIVWNCVCVYTVEPRSIVPVSIVFPHSSFAIFGPE